MYCNEHNYDYYLKISNPIGSFFDYKTYNHDTSNFYVTDMLCRADENKFKQIMHANKDKNIIIISNMNFANPYSQIQTIRKIFRPTADTLQLFNNHLKQYSLVDNNYYAIHIRYGDDTHIKEVESHRKTSDNRILSSVDKHIKAILQLIKNKSLPIVLITDNYNAKVQLSKQYGLRYFDIKPVHTSFTNDITAVKTTVLEFLTLSSALEVFAVSYSGFSYAAAAYGGKSYRCMQ